MADGRKSWLPFPSALGREYLSESSGTENERRAIRVAELMNDYRTLQHYIVQVQATPSNGDYNEEGYSILRQCSNDAQALLSATFTDMQSGGAGLEGEKGQLQGYLSPPLDADCTPFVAMLTGGVSSKRIMIDASVRRFLAQRIYLRATAATRWASSRAAILQGHKAHAGHALALQQVDNQLRAVSLMSLLRQRLNDSHSLVSSRSSTASRTSGS